MPHPLAKAAIIEKLKTKSDGRILYGEIPLGRWVRVGIPRKGKLPATQYQSRIYQGGLRVEVVATTVSALLPKIGAELKAAYTRGEWAPAEPSSHSGDKGVSGG